MNKEDKLQMAVIYIAIVILVLLSIERVPIPM